MLEVYYVAKCVISQQLTGFYPNMEKETKCFKALGLKVPPRQLIWHVSPHANPLWTKSVLGDSEKRCEPS